MSPYTPTGPLYMLPPSPGPSPHYSLCLWVTPNFILHMCHCLFKMIVLFKRMTLSIEISLKLFSKLFNFSFASFFCGNQLLTFVREMIEIGVSPLLWKFVLSIHNSVFQKCMLNMNKNFFTLG